MAFPRGKRTTTSTSSSSKDDKDKRSSKKRPSPSSSTAANQHESATKKTTEKKEKDFLFGSGAAADGNDLNVLASRSKKKRTADYGDHLDDDDDDLRTNKDGLLINNTISTLPLGGGAVLQPSTVAGGRRMPAKIELLSFGKLGKGMKVLGVIREVKEEYAVVSLPTMLTGFVRRTSNGPPLTQVLPPVNTIMAFSILQTTTEEVTTKSSPSSKAATPVKKRRIELSPLPNHVNSGIRLDEFLSSTTSSSSKSKFASTANYENGTPMIIRGRIVSVEDHGCIVDLGGVLLSATGEKAKAFLKFDNIEGDYEVVDDEEGDDDDNMDEDVEDDDGRDTKPMDVDKSSSKTAGSKRLLNKHRVYDFAILPPQTSGEGSLSILQLSLPSTSTLATLRTTSEMVPSLSSLVPGMLMDVQVEQHAKNGMCVSFMKGVYRGALDEDHLGGWRSCDEKKKKGLGGGDSKEDPSMWWKKVFRGKHAKFSARIIAVDAATKIVRLSLNAHILSLRGEYSSFPLPVGTIVQNAQVIRVDPGIGALLALPPSETSPDDDAATAQLDKINHIIQLDRDLSNNLMSISEYKAASKVLTAYVHISKSIDPENNKSNKKGKPQAKHRTPEALFARHFSINSRVKSLRILSTSNLIDGIASCATAKSIVNAHVLTHEDIVPGKIYRNVPVIQLLDGGGVLVDLGLGTKGIIPAMHLFDKASHGNPDAGGDAVLSGYRQKIRQAKYKEGNLVDVRCLTVDPVSRQCILTAKKTLLTTDIENPIVEYTPLCLEIGRVAAGFLSKVDEWGVTVTFYNNVHGRVPARRLAAELGVEDPRMNYNIGDAVAARLLDCFKRRHKEENGGYYYQLELSLKTVLDTAEKSVEAQETVNSSSVGEKDLSAVPLAAGSILMSKRMKVLQLVNSLHRSDGTFLPGYAVVSIKSKFLTGVTSNSDSVECKLSFDQLMDSYGDELSCPPVELDSVAQKELKVGKRIDKEGLILSVPNGGEPIISLRSSLIDTIRNEASSSDDFSIVCPSPSSNLFMGAYVRGYVARKDERFGSFVRFLNGLTGLIPKLKKGLDESLYETILCKVTALDITSSPPKILLKKVSESDISKKKRKIESRNKGSVSQRQIQVGDLIGDVKVTDINFARAKVQLIDKAFFGANIRARIHVTMAEPIAAKPKLSKQEKKAKDEHKIGKSHPFYSWKAGDVIKGVRCVAVDTRDGVSFVELANRSEKSDLVSSSPIVVSDPSQLPPGSLVHSIVTSVSASSPHFGVWVQVCPGISGFVPALELSSDPDILNDIESNYKVGTRLSCCVMEKSNPEKTPLRHQLQRDDHDNNTKEHNALELSVLLAEEQSNAKQAGFKPTKPQRGDVVVGRINKKMRVLGPPALMLNLRGTFTGRCCITELNDMDDWANMPLGKDPSNDSKSGSNEVQRVVSDSEADLSNNENDDDDEESRDEDKAKSEIREEYPDGKFIKCRVLGSARAKGAVELSLRDSRLEGDLEEDCVPEPNDMTHAYVISTTKKGCFVRISRYVEGRVILKELSDDFIPNPTVMFPPGRLVVGKVKRVTKHDGKQKGNRGLAATVDIDMRESVLLSSGNRITLDDIQENSKYTGVVTRIESYGVFVRIENSDVSGLAHVSECSDSYVKNIFDLYNPGDLVKVMVIKFDKEEKRLGFSLKASNFVDDDDSDDASLSDEASSSEEDSDEEEEEVKDALDERSDGEGDSDSDDENFVAKMAAKMEQAGDVHSDNDSESSDDSSADSDDDSESDEKSLEQRPEESLPQAMDANVGFDWGSTIKPTKITKLAESSDDESTDSSSDSSGDESEDEDAGFKSSHKARKKAAAKRREEEEISRREAALADGTADENPETAADFERLVASNPNSSEVWIKFMAFHLSLADIDSARNVANRAFDRIEFRQEGEKLNVWTALLTLELKYGTDKSLQETIDRASQHNNPKQVYLRVCEMLDKAVEAASSSVGSGDLEATTKRADDMFKNMCKKFKSKKTVWIAHFNYLLKGSRHEEAHALLKRSLQSLPPYKHVETMSKFAQMEFELGSPERGRTIFNALLENNPKRMDLLFVNIDKEVKNGDIDKARALFDSVVNPVSNDRKQKFKFKDKQMKSLFKKWYRMEEEHGDETTRERVREEARNFVAKSKSGQHQS